MQLSPLKISFHLLVVSPAISVFCLVGGRHAKATPLHKQEGQDLVALSRAERQVGLLVQSASFASSACGAKCHVILRSIPSSAEKEEVATCKDWLIFQMLPNKASRGHSCAVAVFVAFRP